MCRAMLVFLLYNINNPEFRERINPLNPAVTMFTT
jgi:hypothetical protein